MRIGTNAFTPPPVGAPPQPEPEQPAIQRREAEPGGVAGFELALVSAAHTIVPVDFFKPNGSDALLATLEAEVRKQAAELDISTPERRAAIASLAYKIAKTKTGLDAARKDLVADQKEAIKAVDREGGRVWDRLEALQAEVRKPLTDWETAEKTRIAEHETTISGIDEIAFMASTLSLDEFPAKIAEIERLRGRGWQEFQTRADRALQLAATKLNEALEKAKQAAAEREELKRLRAEEVDRKERERVEAIAEEARAAERRKAEAQMEEQRQAWAAAEAERIRVVENERNEAAARAQQAEAERVQAEERAARDRADAEIERLGLERQARDTAERIERERVEAAERAQRDQDAAVAAERGRLEAEQRDRDRLAEEDAERIRVETAKRERNKAHRRSIEAAAVQGLILCCGDEVTALAVVEAISAGKIPNVKIEY